VRKRYTIVESLFTSLIGEVQIGKYWLISFNELFLNVKKCNKLKFQEQLRNIKVTAGPATYIVGAFQVNLHIFLDFPCNSLLAWSNLQGLWLLLVSITSDTSKILMVALVKLKSVSQVKYALLLIHIIVPNSGFSLCYSNSWTLSIIF